MEGREGEGETRREGGEREKGMEEGDCRKRSLTLLHIRVMNAYVQVRFKTFKINP